jgi:hypothetical protein
MNSRFAVVALFAIIAVGSAAAKVYFEEKFDGKGEILLILWVPHSKADLRSAIVHAHSPSVEVKSVITFLLIKNRVGLSLYLLTNEEVAWCPVSHLLGDSSVLTSRSQNCSSSTPALI